VLVLRDRNECREGAAEVGLDLSLLRRVGEGESDVVRCALCFS